MELQPNLNPSDPSAIGRAMKDAALYLWQQRVTVRITAGAESADTRTITVQAIDRRGRAREGRFILALWVATTEYGPPAGTQTVGAPTAGAIIQTLTSNRSFVCATDHTGKLVFTLTVTGAATRYVYAAVIGDLDESGALTYA